MGTQFTCNNGLTRLRSRFAVVDQERGADLDRIPIGVKVVHRHVLSAAGAHRTRLVTEESMAGRLEVLFFSSPKLEAALDRWLSAISSAAAP